MEFQKGDKVTLTEEMKKSVRDPARYRNGIVAGVSSNGTVEVLWGKRRYCVCMYEKEIMKLRDGSQLTLF